MARKAGKPASAASAIASEASARLASASRRSSQTQLASKQSVSQNERVPCGAGRRDGFLADAFRLVGVAAQPQGLCEMRARHDPPVRHFGREMPPEVYVQTRDAPCQTMMGLSELTHEQRAHPAAEIRLGRPAGVFRAGGEPVKVAGELACRLEVRPGAVVIPQGADRRQKRRMRVSPLAKDTCQAAGPVDLRCLGSLRHDQAPRQRGQHRRPVCCLLREGGILSSSSSPLLNSAMASACAQQCCGAPAHPQGTT